MGVPWKPPTISTWLGSSDYKTLFTKGVDVKNSTSAIKFLTSHPYWLPNMTLKRKCFLLPSCWLLLLYEHCELYL